MTIFLNESTKEVIFWQNGVAKVINCAPSGMHGWRFAGGMLDGVVDICANDICANNAAKELEKYFSSLQAKGEMNAYNEIPEYDWEINFPLYRDGDTIKQFCREDDERITAVFSEDTWICGIPVYMTDTQVKEYKKAFSEASTAEREAVAITYLGAELEEYYDDDKVLSFGEEIDADDIDAMIEILPRMEAFRCSDLDSRDLARAFIEERGLKIGKGILHRCKNMDNVWNLIYKNADWIKFSSAYPEKFCFIGWSENCPWKPNSKNERAKAQRNLIIKDLKDNYFLPEKRLVNKIENLNGLSGKFNSVKEIRSMCAEGAGNKSKIEKMCSEIDKDLRHQQACKIKMQNTPSTAIPTR